MKRLLFLAHRIPYPPDKGDKIRSYREWKALVDEFDVTLACFIDDPVGVATRQFIGSGNIMWSSDYPHTVSTWPNSREVVERDLQGVPEQEKEEILRGNAARLYGFDLTKISV